MLEQNSVVRLFHVSEEPGIARFEPRPSPSWSQLNDDVVWAIDEAHLPNYLLPRDCARVTFRLLPTKSRPIGNGYSPAAPRT